MARTGRRLGDSGTREAILEAARAAFAARGYDRATVRGIARDAGVDPALVHHYHGTKEALFVAAMQLPIDPATLIPALLAPGVDGLGERIVRTFLGMWDSTSRQSPFLALIRSAVSHEQSAAMLRDFITRAVLGRVADALDVPDRELRATLVGSQLVGMGMLRYVLEMEPLASTPPDAIVAAVGPTVQRYLTGDLAG